MQKTQKEKVQSLLLAALLPASVAFAAESNVSAPTFPRLMGMNIGKKHCDNPEYQQQLARLDLVILGFYRGWRPGDGMAQVVRNLKHLSGGKVVVGQYTILNESYDDPKNAATLDVLAKLNDMNWWSIEKWGGWAEAMKRYRAAIANTSEPHWVGFHVQGKTNDYRFLRYAYASCLLDDGLFCYTNSAVGYSSVV